MFFLTKLTLAFCLLLFCCNNVFNPEAVSGKPTSPYLTFDSPGNVLKNLEFAYRYKDLELYKKCLWDSNKFRFELIASEGSDIGVDMDGDGIKDNWWGRTQEIEYHRKMFGLANSAYPPPDNIVLTLSIPPEENWKPDNQEGHEGWIIISVYFYDLELQFIDQFNNIRSRGRADFHMIEENGKWSIALWRDLSNF